MFEGPHADQVQLFISLYFGLTGLHALHMVIGFVLLAVIAWMAHKDRFSPEWYTPVEMSGLYWHFVDIVWIFLFPLLYLVDRAQRRRQDQHHVRTSHPRATYFTVFGTLMVLTAVTVAAAFTNLGVLNFPVALGIAITKATLVILFFMHAKYSSKLTKLLWCRACSSWRACSA